MNIKSYISNLSERAVKSAIVDQTLYNKYDVKRGLRDINGKGVLAGLTDIAEVRAYLMENGETVPCEGKLFYRGIDVEEIVDGFVSEGRFGFEETIYLLLFGELPNINEFEEFKELLAQLRNLPEGFVRDVIMRAPSKDIMNTLARSVLTLYSFDDKADDTSITNVLEQSLRLIAGFPLMAVYGYGAFNHYYNNKSLYIHSPDEKLSIAETILHLLRPDCKYTKLEAQILDLALVLHAEHGGGNNSTFTTHVVSSSGTDTYSSVAASLGSLKGPKHGGANIRVTQMLDDMKKNISNWDDDKQIEEYLTKLLNKEGFDKSGLIYGMGHAVYSLSDPRANILKGWVEGLAKEKGLEDEYKLYLKVEAIAPDIIGRVRKMYKGVSANVDFYSGFVYRMLDIPNEMYTPIFAVARIAGWSAHRIEELVNTGKIIRPAYKNVAEFRSYIKLTDRV